MTRPPPGRLTGSLTDVAGLRVGHHQRTGRGWRTGTTVVLAPEGATAGVDVRGGGPGTRETDVLAPENLVQRIHGICLSGGSAFGLAAADGVMAHLAERHVGFVVGSDPGWVVPIVPAAVVFDLGRGGRFEHRPDASFGWRAARRATARAEANGTVGAGTGALSGGLQGGVGSASTTVELVDGTQVVIGALAVVNSAGSAIDPATALPWEARSLGLGRPKAASRAALRSYLDEVARLRAAPPANTTIGVVATTACLTKAECRRLATVAHDGLARAVRPAHGLTDGDTVFGLATGLQPLPPRREHLRDPDTRTAAINLVLRAGADVFATACAVAVLTARSHPGGPPAYRDLVPEAAMP